MFIRHFFQSQVVDCPKYKDTCALCINNPKKRDECSVPRDCQSIIQSYKEKGILKGVNIDLEQVVHDLQSLMTVKARLGYWQLLMQKNYFEPLQHNQNNWEHKEWIGKHILVKLFGYEIDLFTPLLIPTDLYRTFFEKEIHNPEFSFWFLRYHAEEYFNHLLEYMQLEEKLTSPLADEFIKAELQELEKAEIKAIQLLNEKTIDIYKYYETSEYSESIEILRLKTDYYRRHPLFGVHNIGNETVSIYTTHILLKEFLLRQLKKTKKVSSHQTESQSEGEVKTNNSIPSTRTIVQEAFGFVLHNDPRTHMQILSENDFSRLVDWITFFFENDFELPEINQPIESVKTSKNNIIYTFSLLFKKLHPEKQRPTTLFQLITICFFQFRNDKIENIKKSMGKSPSYYDQLINDKR